MPDKFYPKQRIEDAVHRGLVELGTASEQRQQVRMGDHPERSMQERITYDEGRRTMHVTGRKSKRSNR